MNYKPDSIGKNKKEMETSIEAENPAGFLSTEREALLEILEECMDSLAVYQNILRQKSMIGDDAVNFFLEVGTLEMSNLQSLARDASEMTDSKREAVREKLRRYSMYVSDIIRDLKQEISERGTIEVLIKEIERITSQEKQEHLLTNENGRTQAIATELRKSIADKKTSIEKKEKCSTRKLILIRDEKERLKLVKNVEMSYVRAWETTRREQNVLRYEFKMDELDKTLNDYYIRERNENRINNELSNYLTWRTALIENRIEQWQQRYDREKKMYERKISKVRNEIEDARKYLEKLTTEYRSNQEFIDTYLMEQEVLRKQKEHEDHVRRSTIRIQAWWRGVMVRRKLGPYRPEEKKKKRPVKTKK